MMNTASPFMPPKTIYVAIFIITTITLLTGCQTEPPPKTSLEIQAIQLKEFQAEKTTAFNSTLSVFQDLGYIIDTAHIETGIITAQSPTKAGVDFFTGRTQTYTRATAFIEERRSGFTNIRLNFVEVLKASDGYGQQSGKDTVIYDAEVYQNAFAKIQEAIFIRSATQ